MCCFVGVWTSRLSFHYMVVCVVLLVIGHQGCRFIICWYVLLCWCLDIKAVVSLYGGLCCFVGVWTSRLSFHYMLVCVVLLVFGHQGCRFIICWYVLFCWCLDIKAVVSLYGGLCCFVGVWTSRLSFHYMLVCVVLLVFGHQGCRFIIWWFVLFCWCLDIKAVVSLYVGMCCFVGVWTSRLSFHYMLVCVVLLLFGHQGCRFLELL